MVALPNSTNLRTKINTKTNSSKINGNKINSNNKINDNNKINGEDKKSWDAKPVTLKWHQFHLWIASKDFVFLEQMAKEQEESIARILRRLIRQYRVQMEDSRH